MVWERSRPVPPIPCLMLGAGLPPALGVAPRQAFPPTRIRQQRPRRPSAARNPAPPPLCSASSGGLHPSLQPPSASPPPPCSRPVHGHHLGCVRLHGAGAHAGGGARRLPAGAGRRAVPAHHLPGKHACAAGLHRGAKRANWPSAGTLRAASACLMWCSLGPAQSEPRQNPVLLPSANAVNPPNGPCLIALRPRFACTRPAAVQGD